LTEVTGVGSVIAHDPAAGPVAALVGGGCQQWYWAMRMYQLISVFINTEQKKMFPRSW
jgi:hypothetical protein